ncbi:TPA: flagellar hook-length control protein FliK, partial [Pseudomonas aeruginosa]
EDGKPLPADGQAKADGEDKVETPVDPLQLLGLGGAVPMLDENTQATLLPPAVPTASSAPASLTEASSDPTLVKLNGVPAVNMALEQGAQDAAQAAKGGPAKSADPRQANLGDALASLTSDSLPKAVDGKALEAQLQQTAEPAIASAASESLLESKAEPRGEPFAAKLNGLTQAMAQQALTNRPVNGTVPGQPVAIQQNGWSEAVVDRVMWMSSQNLKSAEIQLDPAELGRLDVRIHMTADQTQVTFASPNAGVRDALESQMHRLRDMFSQQGMNQLDVNVSDQSLARGWQGQQQGEGGSARGRGLAGEASGDEETLAGVSEIRSRPGASAARGLVDYYA